jgi:hypothetical protein
VLWSEVFSSGGPSFDVEPVGGLTRAKTTINVVQRDRSAAVGTDTPQSIRDNDPPPATGLRRNNTANTISGAGRTGLPTRALTVRRPGVNDVAPASVSPKPSKWSLCPLHLHPDSPMGSFPQRHLPRQLTFMTTLWTHIGGHRHHPRLDKTTIASQIGRGIMFQDPHYPGHQVRSEARPALAPSNDVSRGARSRRAYMTKKKRAT